MDTSEILAKVDLAISELIKNEVENLRRELHELNISTRLAYYLIPLFTRYDVDAEYNGDFDKPNDRKALEIAGNRIRELERKLKKRNVYKVTPDIIIHKRKTNTNNLVVIEVKKDTNIESEKEYDLIKLEHLTINYLGNHYNYQLGISITFGTGLHSGEYNMLFFQNGILETDRTKLKEMHLT